MNQFELMINRLAQAIVPIGKGLEWFRQLSPSDQKDMFLSLSYCCGQANPLPSEVAPAIELAGLKPTFTPCVILKNSPTPKQALTQIINLPDAEREKSFRLLVALFSVADKRRRETVCRGGCNHQWHNSRILQASTIEYKGINYRMVLGSDVVNDGMYIELHDPREKILAMVYRSDADGSFEIYVKDNNIPTEFIDKFVEQAKLELAARAED